MVLTAGIYPDPLRCQSYKDALKGFQDCAANGQ